MLCSHLHMREFILFKFLINSAVKENIGSEKERYFMQYNCFWPGTYSFIGELKLFAEWLKNQMNIIMEKIEETENKLA